MPSKRKYLRPSFFLVKIINPILVFFNLLPILSIKGRKSGKIISTPLFLFSYNGEKYLVAPRGETHWVRNLRVAKKGRLTVLGKTKGFNANEIKGKLQEDVVTTYRKKTIIAEREFGKVPKQSDHPVFRITY